MDFSLNEEQTMIRESARDFLKKECPKSLVREAETSDLGYSPALWRKIAELGWLGLVLPEPYGGAGSSFLDLTVIIEELGRALAPVPFLPTLLGEIAILAAGNDRQKQDLLPKIAGGEMILTTALTEAGFSQEPKDIKTRAVRQGDAYLVQGTKFFVPYAPSADLLLCLAKTRPVAPGDGALTLFLVGGKEPGIRFTLLDSVAFDRQYQVQFEEVEVSGEGVLGQVGRGGETARDVLRYATLAHCAWLLGGLQQAFEMTLDSAKDRVQFGRHIGSFQAIQHRIANMAVYLDSARFLVYRAAWKLSRAASCDRDISMARAWVNQVGEQVYAGAHQVRGAVAYCKDDDLGLYSCRARASQAYWGNTLFHLDAVGRSLGLD